MLEEDRPRFLGQAEHGRIEAGHAGHDRCGRSALHRQEAAVVDSQDPHLGQRRPEGVGRDHRPLPLNAARLAEMHVRQEGRILQVQAQFLVGRRVRAWPDRKGVVFSG